MQSDVPIDNVGAEKGDSLDDTMQLTDSADQLISTQTEQALQVADNPRTEPAPDSKTAIALEAGAEATLPLPQDQNATLMIKDENPRQLVTSVDTKESKIAIYLDSWKRRIEMVGVKYFPEQSVIQGITGSPTLQVTINATGQLEAASIRQSSGSRVLDQAALNILRRASPFEPFPETIRVDYDRLIFAYKWKFAKSEIPTTASTL
jgi:protein TonB